MEKLGRQVSSLQQLDADLTKLGPLVTFGWHTQQQFALAAATDVVVVLGGNQSGKTTAGIGIAARVIRREGPIYRRLRHPESRPLKLWIAPQTLEKFKSNWEAKLLHDAFAGMEVEYTQSPFPVFRWHDAVTTKLAEGKPKELADRLRNELWCKSHDQGFLAFESDVVDLVLFDEEPADRRLYTSAKQRGATVNGVVVFTFTPLLGMSWTYNEFYQPCAKDSFKVADRVWKRGQTLTVIQMGMADNPASVAGGGVQRLRDDPAMTEAEKRTRLYGEYGYTEGLIFPQCAGWTTESEDIHFLDALPDSPMSWVLTADPNKRHGAVLCALDPFGNYYLADEHYADSLPDSQHAAAYLAMLAKWGISLDDVLLGADPGGAGAQAILNMAEFDLPFQSVPKDAGSVAASIKLVRRLLWVDPQHVHPITGKLGAPRLYVLRSLRSRWREDGVEHYESRLCYEWRQYRQKPNAPPDTPIKERDDVVDPLRYVMLLRPWSPEPVDEEAVQAKRQRATLDRASRLASEEFDELVKTHAYPKRTRGRSLDE